MLSIPMVLDDFYGEACCNILQLACVGKGSDVLFIDCCYALRESDESEMTVREQPSLAQSADRASGGISFEVVSSSISFDLYSLVEIEVSR